MGYATCLGWSFYDWNDNVFSITKKNIKTMVDIGREKFCNEVFLK